MTPPSNPPRPDRFSRGLNHNARGSGPTFNIRTRAGLTQTQFAAATGLSVATIQTAEREGDYPQSNLAQRAILAFAKARGIEEPNIL